MSAGATVVRSTPVRIELPAPGQLDRLVFDGGACFRSPRARQDDLLASLVREAVEHHAGACALFGDLLARAGFTPDRIQSPADLDLVPQLPVAVFKRRTVRSVAENVQVTRSTSSGTLGTVSTVLRDDTTLARLLGSIRAAIEGLHGRRDEHQLSVVNLGPSSAEAGDLWFAYVLSLVELLFPTVHEVRDGVFDMARAVADLRSLLAAKGSEEVAVIGPPALVHDVATHLLENEAPVDGGVRLHVLTGGGWKRDQSRAVPRDAFDEIAMRAFGLAHRSQIRDTFNQVELNTVFSECAHRRKHVPPWVHVVARDPWTLAPADPGAPGLLSYLDPTANSYPCFIITDDVGVVDGDECPCGLTTRTMSLLRRIERDEDWGCARKMARDIEVTAGRAEEVS
jgi:long-chain-fatty-acid---luciferin-component ligase